MGEAVFQRAGIGIADAEDDAGSGVGEHRARHFIARLQLPQHLVRKREADAILPRPGQNLRHRRCDEGMELIDVAPKIPPLTGDHGPIA